MSLLNGFHKVNSIEKLSENNFLAKITLNPNHEIFKGHFPGNPVTPGVCMLQIVKELAEDISYKKLILSSASNVKFMSIINPEINPDIKLELSLHEADNEIKVKTLALFLDTTALKMSTTYKII